MACDIRLRWPVKAIIAGSSGSGKTCLTSRVIKHLDSVMTESPRRIVVFYAHMQEQYDKFKKDAPCPVIFHKGGPSSSFAPMKKDLLIVDDLQSSHAEIVSDYFTRICHHADCSMIYLVQNVFDKSPHHRSISLNASAIILLRNPRDMSQISYLDKQIFPGGGGLLTKAYRDATSNRPHSYIVIDFHQTCSEAFRIRNTLFPQEDFPHAYVYVRDGGDTEKRQAAR